MAWIILLIAVPLVDWIAYRAGYGDGKFYADRKSVDLVADLREHCEAKLFREFCRGQESIRSQAIADIHELARIDAKHREYAKAEPLNGLRRRR